jgi:ATP-dependent Clp protease, protease subunit
MHEEPEVEKPVEPRLMEKLLKTRTILLFGEVNHEKAEAVTQQLLLLSAESNDDIRLYVNSQGGHVESGDTIFDMIRFVKPRVFVIGTGWVASAGALIYAAPPKEQRFSLPNTRFLLHQPWGGVRGGAADIAIEAEEIVKMRERLNRILSEQTGQPIERVRRDTDRNYWMTAKEAIEYGLVGQIITSVDEVPTGAPSNPDR